MSTETVQTQAQLENVQAQFSRDFFAWVDQKSTGTLIVELNEHATTRVLFIEGCIIDLDCEDEDSVLLRSFLNTGQVSDKELKKAQKRSQKTGESVGRALLERNLIEDETLLEQIVFTVTEQTCLLFTGALVGYQFVPHEAHERVEGFNNELSETFELSFDGEDVILEALERLEDWETVKANRPNFLDIYYATPQGMHYYSEPEAYPEELAVLTNIDGLKDLEEVIEQSEISPFQALRVFRYLELNGEIDMINPIQMYQLGVDTSAEGNHEKARRILMRAIQRGLDDFDVQFKLAECNASIENYDEAIQLFLDFADKCIHQYRQKSAIRAFHRVIDIQPENLSVRYKLISLLIEGEREDDALQLAIEGAELLAEKEGLTEAINVLIKVRSLGLDNSQLRRELIQFAERAGDQELVAKEVASDPSQLEQLKDPAKALASYQRLFAEGNESPEIRIKLVELYLDQRDTESALNHINGILGTALEGEVRDDEKLAWLHRTRRQLDPGNMISSRWLVDFYLREGKNREAVSTIKEYIRQLEIEENEFLLLDSRKKLLALEPDVYDHRWELAEHYRRQSKVDQAVNEIEEIARLAVKHEDPKTTREAWARLLEVAPYHRNGLLGLAECLKNAGDLEGAALRLEASIRLDLMGYHRKKAREVLSQLDEITKDSSEISILVGICYLDSGDKEEGLDLLLTAAESAIQQLNYGSAKKAIERAFCDAPGDPRIVKLQAKIEEALNPPQPTPSQEAKTSGQAKPLSSKEAFQARPALQAKAVSNISTRLKTLKTGPSSPRENSGEHVIKGGVSKSTLGLKKLQNPSSPDSDPGANSNADEDESTQIISKNDGRTKKVSLGNASAKLKALSQSSSGSSEGFPASQETPSPEPAPTAESSSSDGGIQLQKKALGGAAAKLAQLKGGGKPSQPASESTSVEPSTNEPNGEAASAGGEIKVKRALGGAAAKLAALKGGKDSSPEPLEDSTENPPQDPSSNEEPTSSTDGEFKVKRALGGAAQRLAKLKSQDSSSEE